MKSESTLFSDTAITFRDTYLNALAGNSPVETSLGLDEVGALLAALITEGNLFAEPAKWERNIFCHSPGCLILTRSSCVFTPHLFLSVIGKTVIIPLGAIDKIDLGDNFLMRGVVHIILKESLRNRARYTFFLGNKRDEFIRCANQLLL